MVRVRGDRRTLDIFDWQPEEVAIRPDPESVKGHSLRARLCKAIKLAIAEGGLTRAEVADEMSELLGERVTAASIDAWTSQAKADHHISAERLVALMQVCGDPRPLGLLAGQLGLVVIPEKYADAVKEAQLADEIERLERERQAARRGWR